MICARGTDSSRNSNGEALQHNRPNKVGGNIIELGKNNAEQDGVKDVCYWPRRNKIFVDTAN